MVGPDGSARRPCDIARPAYIRSPERSPSRRSKRPIRSLASGASGRTFHPQPSHHGVYPKSTGLCRPHDEQLNERDAEVPGWSNDVPF